jgi:hypothetical protein
MLLGEFPNIDLSGKRREEDAKHRVSTTMTFYIIRDSKLLADKHQNAKKCPFSTYFIIFEIYSLKLF